MTKKLFIVCAALVWTAALVAQNIAVVSPSGDTNTFTTLKEAINGANPNSVIYLPGGSFYANDTVTKKVTIIGIGHKAKTENPDGITYISGRLVFGTGSDGSALMGCNFKGTVYIGANAEKPVNDVLIRYNCITQVCVVYSDGGTIINQNYITDIISATTNFNHNVSISNNVVRRISNIQDGFIANNIIYITGSGINLSTVSASIINNIIIQSSFYSVSSSTFSGNMMTSTQGDNCITVGGDGFSWSDVFVKYEDNNPLNCDFRFKGDYKQYEGQVGIYAGSGFSKNQLAPVPRIVEKHVDEQTNSAGMLNVKVRVKASSEDE